jgi:hypothetical protein
MYLGSAEYMDMARVDGGMLYAERYLSASIEYFMASMELTTCNKSNAIHEIMVKDDFLKKMGRYLSQYNRYPGGR